VPALPLILSFIVAGLLAPAALRSLRDEGHVRENYRGKRLPFPAGWLIVAAAVVALVVLAPLQELAGADDVLRPELGVVVVYVLGVGFLGLVDDVFSGASRGWRGHGRAVMSGRFATGALKAVGSLGLALYVMTGRGYGTGEYLLAVALLVLTTNLFNLLDLRPGRSVKAFVLLGIGLTVGARDVDPLWALGLFAGPVLALGVYDVRERAMLGDTGSNVIGALAGLWMVLALGTTGQIVALVVVLAITVYGEFRSLSAFIERTPGFRQLDSFGRPA
jgi:UDP-N-acetylmuramyl pentapeptide phosphotransferase/UDP-N-acetylglucosamine-1-phosphate transferase